jgi:Mg-chelatase subunit ChlD
MDKTAMLSEYDFIIVVDTSGSMGEPNKASEPQGPTRWQAMQESVLTFVRDVEAIDTDGIDVVQLGGSLNIWESVGTSKIRDIFGSMSPRGGTPLADALKNAFKCAGKSPKKDFIIVFTDGVPDHELAAAKAIVEQSKKQDTDDALTILFIQVGDDAAATRYLRNLDDNLKEAKFDIVDTKTVDEANKFSTTSDLILAAIAD